MEITKNWKPRPFFKTNAQTSDIVTSIEEYKSKVEEIVDIDKIEEFKNYLMIEAAMVELHFDEMVQKLTITNNKGKTRQLLLDKEGNYEAKKFLLDVFKKNCKLDESSFETDKNLGKELQDKFGVNEDCEDYLKEVNFKIKNYCSAQKFALDVRDKALTIEIVKKIHKLIGQNEKEINAGEFRNESVSTGWDSTTHHDQKDVNSSLEKLIDCINKEIEIQKWTPYTIAAYFLYKFYIIHPFLDGNGRVGRIIASAIPYWCGFKFLVVLWFPKNPANENVFKMRKKEEKKHNNCLNKLSRNQHEYYGGNLAYMFLKSHCQTLERFSSFHGV